MIELLEKVVNENQEETFSLHGLLTLFQRMCQLLLCIYKLKVDKKTFGKTWQKGSYSQRASVKANSPMHPCLLPPLWYHSPLVPPQATFLVDIIFLYFLFILTFKLKYIMVISIGWLLETYIHDIILARYMVL